MATVTANVGEVLPVLVADLGNEPAARALEEVAKASGEAWVPLVAGPSEPGRHLLEVYIPSWTEPLRLLAEPLGAAGEHGHALRLFPYDEPSPLVPEGCDPADEEADTPPAGFVSAPPRDTMLGRMIAGDKLQIESLIGQGSIGAVYRARHVGLQLPIAVKVLHRAFQHDIEFCRRFYAEALAMSRLDHPNVVRVQDFGQEGDGLLYLSMAFLDGRSLRTILEQEGPLEPGRAMRLMLQVSAGLSHAHARGLIHRDVKADNVMVIAAVDDDGQRTEQAKVCDFGFAVPPSVSGEVAQRLAGTPVYMSPEQCRGEELDGRTDLYACGVLLYELLTGDVPFLTADPHEIMRMHVTVPPPLVATKRPGIDPRIDRLVQKALAKSRDDRHANLQELRTELKAILRGETRAVDRTSLAPPTPQAMPAPASPQSPDWLERSQGYETFLTGMESARADETADLLSRDPRPWLKKLVEERDGRAFVAKITDLERAVRTLAQRTDVRTLFAVNSAVHGLASERGPRATLASSVLALFGTPEVLTPLAERLLAREDDVKESARALVVNARGPGAFALYGARVKLGGDAHVRVTFVTTMQKLGEHAWPVIRAALARIPEAAMTGAHPVATELAEDLLLCVPAVQDDATGQLVARYASSPVPTLCRAAARAITRLWAGRAAPILAGLLEVPDDGVRTAAIVGLRETGAVDAQIVRRIAPLLAPDASGPSVRAATIAALATSSDDARSMAATILARAVAEPRADDATVLASARALLAVAPEAHGVIRERAATSIQPLRGHLASLIRE